MANCPNCGADVAEDAVACPSCGVSLSDQGQQGAQHDHQQSHQDDSGQQGNQQPQGSRPGQGQPRQGQPQQGNQGQPQGQGYQQGQPQQGQPQGQPQQGQPQGQGYQQGGQPQRGGQNYQQQSQGGQPQQGQPQGQYQQGQGQYQQGQPARGPPGGQGSNKIAGYERREVLKYGGGAALLLGGGFIGFNEFIAGPNDSAAESTVRSYIQEQANGNPEEARSLLHPESTMSPMESGEGISVSFNSVSETESPEDWTGTAPTGEDITYVRTQYEVDSPLGSGTQTRVFQLRRFEGEWRVYSAQNVGS